MFTDFLLQLVFYAQPEKLPAVWIRFGSNYSDKLTQLNVKGKKISGLAAKHRYWVSQKMPNVRLDVS